MLSFFLTNYDIAFLHIFQISLKKKQVFSS